MDSEQDRKLADLLVRAQDGDSSAYELFLIGASSTLRRYLARRTSDPEMVEDILQETLLSIHRARHTYILGRPVGPWLYAICEHRMTDFFRRYRRIEKMEVTTLDQLPEVFSSDGAHEVNDRGDQIREALENLPEKQREVIELLKIHDLSVKEVSAKTGMSESAVKVTAFRGYEEIRRIFGVKSK